MSSHMSPNKGKKGKGPLVPILIGVALVAVGVVIYLVTTGFFLPDVKVPDLMYQDEAFVTQQLADAKLKLGNVSEEVSEEIKVGGFVVRQTPESGTTVKEGSTVDIVYSAGQKLTDPVTVPDVKGMTPEEAETAIIDAMLIPQPGDPIHSEEVEPGRVVMQSVPAGTQIMPLEFVVYQLSLGEEMASVPDVVGKPVGEARDALSQAGLSVDTTQVYNDSVAQDAVVSQSIAKDEEVSKGTTVTLEVSLGARPAAKVNVPNVLTYDVESAKRTLESAGLAYRLTGDGEGTVVSIKPAAGTQVDQGSTVEIEIRKPQPQPQPQAQPQQEQPQDQPQDQPQEQGSDQSGFSRDDLINAATSLVNDIIVRNDIVSAENILASDLEYGDGTRVLIVDFDMNGLHFSVNMNRDTAAPMSIDEIDSEGNVTRYDGQGNRL